MSQTNNWEVNLTKLHWNEALWLDVSSHMSIFNQSERIISA